MACAVTPAATQRARLSRCRGTSLRCWGASRPGPARLPGLGAGAELGWQAGGAPRAAPSPERGPDARTGFTQGCHRGNWWGGLLGACPQSSYTPNSGARLQPRHSSAGDHPASRASTAEVNFVMPECQQRCLLPTTPFDGGKDWGGPGKGRILGCRRGWQGYTCAHAMGTGPL